SEPIPAPRAELFYQRKLVPAWAVRLVVGTLILPALLAAVDAFARVRRRREPMARWLEWALAGAIPFVAAWLFALFLEFTALLLPGLHLALLLLAPDVRLRRGLQALLVLVGLAPLLLVTAYYADQFGLSLGEVPWTALLLVVGGAVALPTVLAWCLGLGLLGSI